MAQIFISYSSKSRDMVSVLAQDFETAGHNVWFDKELTGGQSWWDQILTNIRACEIFAFAMTPEAIESKACEREYTYAHALGKPILPVLMKDGVSPNLLPPILTTIQFVDYRKQDKAAAFALIRALNDVPPAAPLPHPLPAPPDVPISYLSNLRVQIESPDPLTFQEQSALVFRLRQGLQEHENVDDIRSLLVRLKKRDDLLAKVGDEINGLLINSGGLSDVTPVPARRENAIPSTSSSGGYQPTPPTPSSSPVSSSPEPLTAKVSSAANTVGAVGGEVLRSASEGFNAARSRVSGGGGGPASFTPNQMPPTSPPPSGANYTPPSQPYQSGGSYNYPSSTPYGGSYGEPWSTAWLIGLWVGTIIIWPIGLIAGIIGMRTDAKKGQAKPLLIFSIVYGIISVLLYLSQSSYY